MYCVILTLLAIFCLSDNSPQINKSYYRRTDPCYDKLDSSFNLSKRRDDGHGSLWNFQYCNYIDCTIGYILFCLNVHSCTHWLRPRTPPPPHLGSYTRALLVSLDRRHLFVTPFVDFTSTIRRGYPCTPTSFLPSNLHQLVTMTLRNTYGFTRIIFQNTWIH